MTLEDLPQSTLCFNRRSDYANNHSVSQILLKHKLYLEHLTLHAFFLSRTVISAVLPQLSKLRTLVIQGWSMLNDNDLRILPQSLEVLEIKSTLVTGVGVCGLPQGLRELTLTVRSWGSLTSKSIEHLTSLKTLLLTATHSLLPGPEALPRTITKFHLQPCSSGGLLLS